MPTAPTPLVASSALVSPDSLVMELTAQVSNALLVTAACEVPLYTLRHWWVWPWYGQLSPKCHMYWHCWKLWVQMWFRVHWKWDRLWWWVTDGNTLTYVVYHKLFCNTDINECILNMDNCDDQTTLCSNNFGSFDCVCRVGYHNLSGNTCQRELFI